MIKRVFLGQLLFMLLSCMPVSAQHLLSDSLLRHYSQAQVQSIFTSNGVPFAPTCGLYCYRLIYSTQNARQTDTTIASGLVLVPDAYTCPMPIAMYDHGTVMQKTDVPSWLNGESVIPMILAEQGYYAIAPDYLGLGVSPGFHPYIHARSEAQAGIDLIFASKTFAAQNNIELNQQLFLTGYSQGGHACMATHRAIQQNYAGQLTVTASCPGSGPYNLSGIQSAGLANNSYYADPSYIPYITMAYQSVYNNLYDTISHFLSYPWDSILPPYYNGQYSTATVDALMPHYIDSFVVDTVLARYRTDSINDPLRIDLRDNDVYAWVPASPVQMVYCTLDEQVVYQSTTFTLNYFLTHGDSTATAVDGGAYTHENCVSPYLFNMVTYFSNYMIAENNLTLTLTGDSASPPGANNASVKVSVSGGTGYSISWNTGSIDTMVTGLSDGIYTVTVTDSMGCNKVRSVSTGGVTTGIAGLSIPSPGLHISPNPASGFLTIRATGLRPDVITIYDVNGQKVDEQKFTSLLDVSRLSEGVYIIEVRNDQATARSRFVKM
jgi:hypothetical protein